MFDPRNLRRLSRPSLPFPSSAALIFSRNSLQSESAKAVDAASELGEQLEAELLSDSEHVPPTTQIKDLEAKLDSLRQLRIERAAKAKEIADRFLAIEWLLPDWPFALPETESLNLSDLDMLSTSLDEIIAAKDDRLADIRVSLAELQAAASRIPQHYIPSEVAVLLENMSPSPFDTDDITKLPVLSLSVVENFGKAAQQLEDVARSLSKQLGELIKEIETFWEDMDIAQSHRIQLVHDLSNFGTYESLCETLRQNWSVTMKQKVDEILANIKKLWTKCHVLPIAQQRFLESISKKLYSPATMALLEQELATLKLRYTKCREIYRIIDERAHLLKKMKEFETTASDPKRLFRPSFQLNEEEKFRKTCYPTLIKMEAHLRQAITQYEAENKETFLFYGEVYLDVLEAEPHKIQPRRFHQYL
eukprot:jgi/Hompol1/5812/HPOL_000729-RA